jgi:hypothetical protein
MHLFQPQLVVVVRKYYKKDYLKIIVIKDASPLTIVNIADPMSLFQEGHTPLRTKNLPKKQHKITDETFR